jgi:hypothetical protein
LKAAGPFRPVDAAAGTVSAKLRTETLNIQRHIHSPPRPRRRPRIFTSFEDENENEDEEDF